MAGPETKIEERSLSPEDVERVWDILHKNMNGDDRYPEEVVVSPPWNGDRVAYCNAMRCRLDGSVPF